MRGVFGTYLKGAIAPVAVAIALLLIPQDWRDRLKDFQQLLGGTIALGAAVIGFSNLHEQLTAQRVAESAKNTREDEHAAAAAKAQRAQVAGALLGEVETIMVLLRNRRVAGWYEDMRAWMVAHTAVNFGGSLSVGSDYSPVYETLGTGIGQLENGLSQQVVYFYGLLHLVMDRIKAAESGTYDHWPLEAATGMATGIVLEVREVEEKGAALANALRAYLGQPSVPGPAAVAS